MLTPQLEATVLHLGRQLLSWPSLACSARVWGHVVVCVVGWLLFPFHRPALGNYPVAVCETTHTHTVCLLQGLLSTGREDILHEAHHQRGLRHFDTFEINDRASNDGGSERLSGPCRSMIAHLGLRKV